MLQRFKLGTKLALVVALALAAVTTVAVVGYTTLQKVEIGSDAYQRSIEYEQLIADVLPPPQYVVESYLTANRVLRATSAADISGLTGRLRLLKGEYYAAHAKWVERFAADGDAADRAVLRDALLVQSFTPAETFWNVTVDEFIPAAEAGQMTRAASLLDGPMTAAYTQHRGAIENVVTLAQSQRALHERATNRDIDQRLLVVALTVFGSLLAVAAAGFVLARSIRRPVQELTDAVNATATELPRLVAKIENARADAPLPVVEPIAVRAKDELAELATAFNSVRQTALELAAKQAATRRSITELFVNLGRRNQALINRQLSFIDQLERGEEDPDTLEDLFRLDHLATRMRRNAESLLVLAGAETNRRWTESIEVGNVVRSALSEIEEYNQVDLGEMERVHVRGSVVADVAHLLAELLENATAFSPPMSNVTVTGKMLSDGYVISIVDEGIGMDAAALAEANKSIEAVARLDQAPTRVLGLYVVGCLAARHAIRVRLVPSPGHGITARVMLPMSAIETPRPSQTPIQAIAAAPPAALERVMSRLGDQPARPGAVVAAQPAGPTPADAPLPARTRVAQPAAVASGDPASTDEAATLPGPAHPPAHPPANDDVRPGVMGELTHRVRGAQLPDAGPARVDDAAPARSAEDVRALLTLFRSGVERGLQDSPDGSLGTNEGDQR